jgi:hypothetical protein
MPEDTSGAMLPMVTRAVAGLLSSPQTKAARRLEARAREFVVGRYRDGVSDIRPLSLVRFSISVVVC